MEGLTDNMVKVHIITAHEAATCIFEKIRWDIILKSGFMLGLFGLGLALKWEAFGNADNFPLAVAFGGFLILGLGEMFICLPFQNFFKNSAQKWIKRLIGILCTLAIFEVWLWGMDAWFWLEKGSDSCCFGGGGDEDQAASCDWVVFKVVKQLCKETSLQWWRLVPVWCLTAAGGLYMSLGSYFCRPKTAHQSIPENGSLAPNTSTKFPPCNLCGFRHPPNNVDNKYCHLKLYVLPDRPLCFIFRDDEITTEGAEANPQVTSTDSPNGGGSQTTEEASEFGGETSSQTLTQTGRRRQAPRKVKRDPYDMDQMFTPVIHLSQTGGSQVSAASASGSPRRSERLSQSSSRTVIRNRRIN